MRVNIHPNRHEYSYVWFRINFYIQWLWHLRSVRTRANIEYAYEHQKEEEEEWWREQKNWKMRCKHLSKARAATNRNSSVSIYAWKIALSVLGCKRHIIRFDRARAVCCTPLGQLVGILASLERTWPSVDWSYKGSSNTFSNRMGEKNWTKILKMHRHWTNDAISILLAIHKREWCRSVDIVPNSTVTHLWLDDWITAYLPRFDQHGSTRKRCDSLLWIEINNCREWAPMSGFMDGVRFSCFRDTLRD